MIVQGIAELNRICDEIRSMSDDELGKLFDQVTVDGPDPFYGFAGNIFLGDISELTGELPLS
jgi:hypothetical protein